MAVKTFSPEAVTVVISTGDINHIVSGYAEGTMISLEPNSQRSTPYYGAQGTASRAMNPVRAYTMTVTLAQTSHSNDVLNYILENDQRNWDGTFVCTVKDASGTTIYNDEFAYITDEPTVSFSGGGSIESREWMIELPEPSGVTGGNGRFSSDEQLQVERLGGSVSSKWSSAD